MNEIVVQNEALIQNLKREIKSLKAKNRELQREVKALKAIKIDLEVDTLAEKLISNFREANEISKQFDKLADQFSDQIDI